MPDQPNLILLQTPTIFPTKTESIHENDIPDESSSATSDKGSWSRIFRKRGNIWVKSMRKRPPAEITDPMETENTTAPPMSYARTPPIPPSGDSYEDILLVAEDFLPPTSESPRLARMETLLHPETTTTSAPQEASRSRKAIECLRGCGTGKKGLQYSLRSVRPATKVPVSSGAEIFVVTPNGKTTRVKFEPPNDAKLRGMQEDAKTQLIANSLAGTPEHKVKETTTPSPARYLKPLQAGVKRLVRTLRRDQALDDKVPLLNNRRLESFDYDEDEDDYEKTEKLFNQFSPSPVHPDIWQGISLDQLRASYATLQLLRSSDGGKETRVWLQALHHAIGRQGEPLTTAIREAAVDAGAIAACLEILRKAGRIPYTVTLPSYAHTVGEGAEGETGETTGSVEGGLGRRPHEGKGARCLALRILALLLTTAKGNAEFAMKNGAAAVTRGLQGWGAGEEEINLLKEACRVCCVNCQKAERQQNAPWAWASAGFPSLIMGAVTKEGDRHFQGLAYGTLALLVSENSSASPSAEQLTEEIFRAIESGVLSSWAMENALHLLATAQESSPDIVTEILNRDDNWKILISATEARSNSLILRRMLDLAVNAATLTTNDEIIHAARQKLKDAGILELVKNSLICDDDSTPLHLDRQLQDTLGFFSDQQSLEGANTCVDEMLVSHTECSAEVAHGSVPAGGFTGHSGSPNAAPPTNCVVAAPSESEICESSILPPALADAPVVPPATPRPGGADQVKEEEAGEGSKDEGSVEENETSSAFLNPNKLKHRNPRRKRRGRGG